ncbi:MAG: bile acid:sodium symporter [Methanothrix sp.]|nr:bile acid:sodium symporter [Methanothrix sp.]
MNAEKWTASLLKNSSFILLLSIAVGLAFPGPARVTEWLITPVLMLMMAFSLTGVKIGKALAWRTSLKSSLLGLFLNYGLLSGLILLLSYNLQDEALRQGFIVMAAVPPAVAVLPMTRLLKGDALLSLCCEAVSYLASLVLMPAIIFILTRQTGISGSYLVQISLAMILLPALASRAAARIPIDPVLPINLGFFLVTYTVIGLNHATLWQGSAAVAAIVLARTFAIGLAIYAVALLAGQSRSRAISYTLLGSYKNLGLAAAVSLMLFGPAASLPAAYAVLAETAFFILLTIIKPR